MSNSSIVIYIELLRVAAFVFGIVMVYLFAFRWLWCRVRGQKTFVNWLGWTLVALAAVGTLCIAYGLLIEPKRLTITGYTIATNKIPAGKQVRIVQIADLHVREYGAREKALPALVDSLHPDLILHTGDLFGKRHGAAPIVTNLLRSWKTPQYACEGNLDFIDDFNGCMYKAGVTVMHGSRVWACDVGGAKLSLIGFPPGGESDVHAVLKEMPKDTFNIVLYHYPSGFAQTWGTPVDLMLAGHVHGGQVRLPGYGALVTLDKFGKRWEYGEYRENGVELIVSRGLGCEPVTPEVRFLCPPEVVVIDVVGI